MVASATAGTSSPAGLFATIEQADGYLQFHSVLRGGQLLSKVHPGDILLAIDHVPCRDYSVTDIQRLIVGPEGSQVHLKILRTDPSGGGSRRSKSGSDGPPPSGTEFEFVVFRTSTELQDIQIALLLELNDMIDDPRHPSESDSTYQQKKLCSWRKSGSPEAMLYDQMCNKMKAIKMQSQSPLLAHTSEAEALRVENRQLQQEVSKLNDAFKQMKQKLNQAEKQKVEVQTKLDEVQPVIHEHKQEVKRAYNAVRFQPHACQLTLSSVPADWLTNQEIRDQWRVGLCLDIGLSLGISPERLQTGRIRNLGESGVTPEGSTLYKATIDVIVSAQNIASHEGRFFDSTHAEESPLNTPELCGALVEQARDRNSILRRTEFGRYVTSADKTEIMEVIVAMKGMIRAAENSRDHLHVVDKVAGQVPSTNPFEKWLTGAASQHVEARAAFEEPASPLYASRSPILRHVASPMTRSPIIRSQGVLASPILIPALASQSRSPQVLRSGASKTSQPATTFLPKSSPPATSAAGRSHDLQYTFMVPQGASIY